MNDLARRAMACKGWRWLKGMSDNDGDLFFGGGCWASEEINAAINAERIRLDSPDELPAGYFSSSTPALPDLSDPATVGCLLSLVREAWASPALQVSPRCRLHDLAITRWVVYANRADCDRMVAEGDTEIEALVAALEAAP
jgi:hypothetical protein